MKSYAIIERATGCVVKIVPAVDGRRPVLAAGHFAEEINWPITEGWHFDRRKKRFLSPLHEEAELPQRRRASGE